MSEKLITLRDKLEKAKSNKALPENMREKLIAKYEGEIAELEKTPEEEPKAKEKKPKKEKKIKKEKVTPSSEPKKKKGKTIDLGYDCDELIAAEKEKAKKRKEAKIARENAPKKSATTKAKEKIENVAETTMDRVESGKATKAEILKLIESVKKVLAKLQKAYDKL